MGRQDRVAQPGGLSAHCGNRARLREKGTQVFIEGKIQTRSWDDKESGQKKYRTEILINELSLLGGGAGRSEGSSPSGGYSSSRASSSSPAPTPSNDYADQGITDEDIPF